MQMLLTAEQEELQEIYVWMYKHVHVHVHTHTHSFYFSVSYTSWGSLIPVESGSKMLPCYSARNSLYLIESNENIFPG